MIAMSLAISRLSAYCKCWSGYWILPWIDSARRHDRHELGDRQCFGLDETSGLIDPHAKTLQKQHGINSFQQR
jgi:hypothetical protein